METCIIHDHNWARFWLLDQNVLYPVSNTFVVQNLLNTIGAMALWFTKPAIIFILWSYLPLFLAPSFSLFLPHPLSLQMVSSMPLWSIYTIFSGSISCIYCINSSQYLRKSQMLSRPYGNYYLYVHTLLLSFLNPDCMMRAFSFYYTILSRKS